MDHQTCLSQWFPSSKLPVHQRIHTQEPSACHKFHYQRIPQSRLVTMRPSKSSRRHCTELLYIRYVFTPLIHNQVQKLTKIQCVDITFADPSDPEINEVNETNCFNSSDISFNNVYSIAASTTSGAQRTLERASFLPLLALALWALL